MQESENPSNSMREEGSKKSAAVILRGLEKARDDFKDYQSLCDEIDEVYSEAFDTWSTGLIRDPEYDLFWAYTEVMKPAVYARSPIPVVAPMFNDRDPLKVTAAELVERAEISAFQRADIDEPMRCTRDDLIMYSRGVQWVTYEEKDGEKRICVDHVDRKDFRHPKARKWSEVPWVARGVWLFEHEFKARFPKVKWREVPPTVNTDMAGYSYTHEGQARIWEVWHKGDKKVYWVAEGYPDILDASKPHLDLKGFYPCPRPAYGTTRPNSLMPIPDYTRYVGHFRQINSLTRRIYTLLERIRMKGLIPSGGDLGTAIEALLNDDSNASFLIPVDGAALLNNPGNFVQWMPLREIAEAIQGLMSARTELFADFDRLSGISDIMRGETDAQETLGAQRMKSQYGSIRVRGKIDELVRVARDVTQIAAEIMSENYDSDTLLEMAQMDIPTEAEVNKSIKAIENAAKEELADLAKVAQEQGGDVDPAQVEQQFQQAQQQVIQKHAAELAKMQKAVTIEAVMKLLRDNKARCFAFEIQTDSTILTDEAQAKASANEFYAAFTGGMNGLMQAASMGPEVMRAAAEVFKMVLGPYRPPRSVMAAIDDMLDAAPQIAQQMQASQQDGGEGDMKELAAAEMEKAKAQMAKVEADAALKQAELQQRMAQMQIDTGEKQAKLQMENNKLQLQASKQEQEFAAKMADLDAKQNLMQAQTAKILAEIGLDVRRQDLEEYRAATDTAMRQEEIARDDQQKAFDNEMRVVDSERAASMGDRQQTLAERQAMDGGSE